MAVRLPHSLIVVIKGFTRTVSQILDDGADRIIERCEAKCSGGPLQPVSGFESSLVIFCTDCRIQLCKVRIPDKLADPVKVKIRIAAAPLQRLRKAVQCILSAQKSNLHENGSEEVRAAEGG